MNNVYMHQPHLAASSYDAPSDVVNGAALGLPSLPNDILLELD